MCRRDIAFASTTNPANLFFSHIDIRKDDRMRIERRRERRDEPGKRILCFLRQRRPSVVVTNTIKKRLMLIKR